MPEISGLLILILIFGFNYLRKKMLQAADKEQGGQSAVQRQQPVTPAFPEAAPAIPARSVPISKIRSVSPKAVAEPNDAQAEGETTMWLEERKAPLPAAPAPAAKQKTRVMPVFSKDSLIQGIILHEILTRPKHAVSSYLTKYHPQV